MRRRVIAAALLVFAGAAGVLPAVADIAQPAVVSANPADHTPHVLDGTVWAMAVVGDTVVVGGSFTKVADRTRRQTFDRRNLFAFGLRDGAIRPFAPTVDGPVYALAAGPANSVYVGGAFKNIAGGAQRGVARLSLATSRRYTSFAARINWGDVRALAIYGSKLYLGGTFTAINGVPRTALARINAGSGAVDAPFNAQLSAPGLRRARVEHFDLSPDGRRLAAVGAILKAAGKDRVQIVLLDVAGSAAVVTGWYTDAYRPQCMRGFDTYLRQVKFAPDGSYLVAVTTGRSAHPGKLCDSAARFEVTRLGRTEPTWVNHTGGDSLYSVAVTGAAVYVGGHQRWMNNRYGNESAGPGAVARPGIAALDPRTGRALPWNPTRSRGVGVRSFVATPVGLLVGSDTDQLGREYHGRIGMFPLP